jgi:hypothetical protein
LDVQPAMPPLQTCLCEQPPPSLQLSPLLLSEVQAPKKQTSTASAIPIRDIAALYS